MRLTWLALNSMELPPIQYAPARLNLKSVRNPWGCLTMRDAAYQRSHHEQLCVFSPSGCFGDVVGHHVKVAGLSGMGVKAPDYCVIPVCHKHHELCESNVIPKRHQVRELLNYWLERLTQEHGQAKAVDMMGRAYWAALP